MRKYQEILYNTRKEYRQLKKEVAMYEKGYPIERYLKAPEIGDDFNRYLVEKGFHERLIRIKKMESEVAMVKKELGVA